MPAAQSTEVASQDNASSPIPPIPACRMDAAWLHGFNLLLWVRSGTACVHFDDGSVRRIRAGEGAWIPPGGRTAITTSVATVAFPFRVPSSVSPRPPSRPLSFAVPHHWQDWLLLHFLHGSSSHGIFGYSASELGSLLCGDQPQEPRDDSLRSPGEEPPLPRAFAARSIAQELRADPAIDHSIDRWAALSSSSVSTVRRGFLDDGWTFSSWRNATRLAAGCELLASGHPVDAVAIRVGFGSRHGFTRAFGRLYGMTPSEYATRMSVHSVGSLLRNDAANGTAALASMIEQLTETPGITSTPRPLPATRTSWHRNDVHVLAWLYKGSGDLNFSSTHHFRREGDAIWIPAGELHQAGTDAGSVGLPIGYLSPEQTHISQSWQVHFPQEWNDYLLHRAVTTRTQLRPQRYDATDILDLFADQLAQQRSQTVPMPTSPRASAVATRFLADMKSQSGMALDADIHRSFRSETGMTIAQWRHHARMDVARRMLESGARPTDIARRIGYRRLRSFSSAFRRRFGHSPRDHQSRRS